jgi:hypothetical protein
VIYFIAVPHSVSAVFEKAILGLGKLALKPQVGIVEIFLKGKGIF